MINNKQPIFLSVIIPSYNEAKNFQRHCLDKLLPFLEKQGYSYEVIFSDDGSTDETPNLLEDFIAKWQPSICHGRLVLVNNKHYGKATTVYSGIKKAQGEWRLFTDFDQSTPISEIKKLLPFTSKYDIIFGSRKLNTKDIKAKWYRKIAGDTFNFITRSLTGLKIKDTQCGFKMFSKNATSLFEKLYVYSPKRTHETGAFTGAFDVELFVIAKENNFTYKEVPIKWRHFSTNRVNMAKDSLRMFIDVVKIKQAKERGLYKI